MARQSTIKATDVHRRFGQLLKRVYNSDEHLIVEREGYPVAVIMSYQEYDQYRRELAHKRFEELGRKLGAEAEKQSLTEEQLFKEIKATRKEIFKEQYGHLLNQE